MSINCHAVTSDYNQPFCALPIVLCIFLLCEHPCSCSAYTCTRYQYKYSHIWADFGIILGLFAFFLTIAIVGLECQKPPTGRGSVNIFKRGKAPATAPLRASPPDDDQKKSLPGNVIGFVDGPPVENVWSKRELNTRGIFFVWSGLEYGVTSRGSVRTLLHDQQGYLASGKLVALMGSSGCGKTTLLSALAQRLDGGLLQGLYRPSGSSHRSSV